MDIYLERMEESNNNEKIIYFDYNFTSNENINLNFNYKILGKLLIMDVDEKNTFFEREYIDIPTELMYNI